MVICNIISKLFLQLTLYQRTYTHKESLDMSKPQDCPSYHVLLKRGCGLTTALCTARFSFILVSEPGRHYYFFSPEGNKYQKKAQDNFIVCKIRRVGQGGCRHLRACPLLIQVLITESAQPATSGSDDMNLLETFCPQGCMKLHQFPSFISQE